MPPATLSLDIPAPTYDGAVHAFINIPVASSRRVKVSPLLTNFSPPSVYLDQSVDDGAAVRRCLSGDPAAFETLVARYQHIMFNVALRMLGDTRMRRMRRRTPSSRRMKNSRPTIPTSVLQLDLRILMNECLNLRRRPATDLLGDSEDTVHRSVRCGRGGEAERKRDVRHAILSFRQRTVK